jgi:hypothetical protein
MVSGVSLATLVTATPAGAAKVKAPAYYSGATSANVLGIALNLPSALPELPGLPKNMAINLIGVNGTAVHNVLGTGAKTASKSVATLATVPPGSLLETVAKPLGLTKQIVATLGQPAQQLTDIPIDASPLLKLDVGKLAAAALPTSNTGESILTSGEIAQLGQLLNLKGVGANATTLLNTIQQQLTGSNGVGSTVTGLVNNALNTVGNALNQPGLTAQAEQVLNSLQSTLQGLLSKITSIVNNVGDTAVVKVGVLDAAQSIAPSVLNGQKAATANAVVSLGNAADQGAVLNVLDGLVTVKAYTSHATVTSNGRSVVPDYTKAAPPIVQVGVSNLLTATLGANGLQLSGSGLPQSIQDTVNSVLSSVQDALNTLLNVLGVHIQAVPGSYSFNRSTGVGTAFGAGYLIKLDDPLDSSAPLLEVGLGGLHADSTGAVHPGPMASISAAQAPHLVKIKNPQAGALPHTGANLPLIGGTGLALLIGAAVLRRRMAQV